MKKVKALRRKNESGQSMVEFALVLPILLLVLCGIIDFGWMFFNQLSLNNLCREGARYAIVNAGDKSDAAKEAIREHIRSSSPSMFDDNLDRIGINFVPPLSDEADVVVTLTTDMVILTPVLSTISGGARTKELVSTVTMKVES